MTDDSAQTPIVVGVDGSEAALGAVRWATTLAAALDVPIHLVHAIPHFDWFSPTALALSSEDLQKELQDVGNKQLAEAEAVVRATNESVPVEGSLVDGPVADVFAELSEGSRIVVLGAHWSSRASDVLLGGQTIRVINRAQCPVLAWRKEPGTTVSGPRPIVVGVDDSDNAKRSLVQAFSYADTLQAPLVVAHFWSMAAAVGLGYTAAYIDWDALGRENRQWVDDLVAPLAQQYPGVDVQIVSTDSAPARGLNQLSESAQLVVVGTRGRGQLTGAVLGSVSQNLVHHARCSVLVVP